MLALFLQCCYALAVQRLAMAPGSGTDRVLLDGRVIEEFENLDTHHSHFGCDVKSLASMHISLVNVKSHVLRLGRAVP